MQFVSPSSWHARCVRCACVRASERNEPSVSAGLCQYNVPSSSQEHLLSLFAACCAQHHSASPKQFLWTINGILCYRTSNVAFIAFLFRVPSPIISAKWPANTEETPTENKIHKIARRAVVVGIPNFQLFIFIWKSYPVNSPRCA